MARGQYEIPPGLPRPKPAFGPSRPPSLPSRIVPSPSPTSTTSSPASPIGSPGKQNCRADIVVLSMTRSEQFERQIESVKSQFESDAHFEEVDTYDEAMRALAQQPSVVVMSEDALLDPSLELVAAQCIRNGATLCTDPSRLPSSIRKWMKHSDEPFRNVHPEPLSRGETSDKL